MSRGLPLNRVAASLLVGAACALLPVAQAAAAPFAKRGASPLSGPLEALARPDTAGRSPAVQAERLGLPPSGPGSLVRDGGRVLVRVRFQTSASTEPEALRAAGGRVISASRAYRSATVAVAPARLDALAEAPEVVSVSQVRAPLLWAVDCNGGSVLSEGVPQLNADAAQAIFGVDGAGVTVGVLSDSYDRATGTASDAGEDVESADLPGAGSECAGQATPVDVIEDLSGNGSDEGRAMLQIVHDMAPGAALSFATAFESEEGFAENIRNLASVGADVIVDDVAWFEEPFFQDGPIAVAVNEVANEGVTYLSAAGNDNLFEGEREIASWEAPGFRDSGGCPEAVEKLGGFNGFHCMDFDPGAGADQTFGITVEAGETLSLDLQWAEPWFGVGSDLDAFLLSGTGKILGSSTEDNASVSGTQQPVEILQWKNSAGTARTVQLAINRYSGANPRLKFILLQNGGGVSGTEYPESVEGDVVGPSIFGHAGAAGAIAVGAVPFDDSSEPEPYSSRGPVAHYFGPVEGATPASPLPIPEHLSKPDVAATDCGATTFFAFLSAGVWRFCGTSAAAPHAAGAVALMRDGAPAADAGLLRASLVGTALAVGGFGPCAVGGGLVETVAAVKAAREEITPGEPEACIPPEGTPAPPNPGGGAPAQIAMPPGDSPPIAPDTLILRHPRKVVRTSAARARVVFRFGSSTSGVTFLCKIDRAAFGACRSRIVRRLGAGSHVVKVKARSSAGLVDPTPAVFRFRVFRSA